jgi:hypothetical protein
MVQPNVATRRRPTGSVGAEDERHPAVGRMSAARGDRTMKHRTRLFATLAAVALLATASATAFGYSGQVEGSITVSGTPTCEPFVMTATVLDGAGAPVVGQSVAWAFVTSPSASDVIAPTPTITDSNGKATTSVTFAPVSGNREIRATAGSVSASAVLSPAKCGSVEAAEGTPRPEGLPSTSTLPADSSGGTPIAALFLAAVGALAGALALRHRVAATRS